MCGKTFLKSKIWKELCFTNMIKHFIRPLIWRFTPLHDSIRGFMGDNNSQPTFPLHKQRGRSISWFTFFPLSCFIARSKCSFLHPFFAGGNWKNGLCGALDHFSILVSWSTTLSVLGHEGDQLWIQIISSLELSLVLYLSSFSSLLSHYSTEFPKSHEQLQDRQQLFS